MNSFYPDVYTALKDTLVRIVLNNIFDLHQEIFSNIVILKSLILFHYWHDKDFDMLHIFVFDHISTGGQTEGQKSVVSMPAQ